jgi:hypothetical protein
MNPKMSPPKSYAVLLFIFILAFSVTAIAADDSFVDNGDGTVTDRKSGLMWAKTDNHFDIYWKQAQQWSRKEFPATLSRKYDNWRLPTLAELQSLYVESADYDGYRSDCGYQVKSVPQIRLSCTIVWSSETAVGSPLAYNFYIGDAFAIDLHDNKGCRVLAVRNLK